MERDRIEIDPGLEPVWVPAELLHELFQHALETDPEECCGLVLSRGGERYGRAVRCRNEMTRLHQEDPQAYPRDGYSAYHMNPRDVLEVQREAEESGERVTAVYHSHVGAGSYLSRMDIDYAEQELFPFPDADQFVISVFEGAIGGQALFRRVDGGWRGLEVRARHG